jgi:hypothetical protein
LLIAQQFPFLLFAGLLSWSAEDCHVNLEEELNTITAQGLEGEEGKNGKINKLIIYEDLCD